VLLVLLVLVQVVVVLVVLVVLMMMRRSQCPWSILCSSSPTTVEAALGLQWQRQRQRPSQ
jgi:hypothetical protein